MGNPHPEHGLFASARRLLATVLEIAQVRLELLGTELELEKKRLFDGLLWGAISVMLLGISITLACGFIILLFWDGYRLAAVGVMALVCFTTGFFLLLEARKRLQTQSSLFASSVSELAQDRAELQTPAPQHAPR